MHCGWNRKLRCGQRKHVDFDLADHIQPQLRGEPSVLPRDTEQYAELGLAGSRIGDGAMRNLGISMICDRACYCLRERVGGVGKCTECSVLKSYLPFGC